MDGDLRSARRAAAGGDADALRRWATRAWRADDQRGALDALIRADQGEAAAALLRRLEPAERRRAHGSWLARLAAYGIDGAGPALRAAYPSVARIRCRPAHRPILDLFLGRATLSNDPIRLASRSNEDQLRVASSIHELRGSGGFLEIRNDVVCPAEEARNAEHRLSRGSWSTLFVYELTESHYSRLVDPLSRLCAEASVQLIYGIRLDAWDGDRFEPFDGLALTLPPIALP